MPKGMGVVDPVHIEIALGNFDVTSKLWASLIRQEPNVHDVTDDGRPRVRFASTGVTSLDLVQASGSVRAGDCRLTMKAPDVAARVAALQAIGVPVSVDKKTGDARIAAKDANGIDVILTETRPPEIPGPPLAGLPYVYDFAVNDLTTSVPVWAAILGVDGVVTPEDADASGTLEMHHYVTDGDTHAIGLMKCKADKKDSPDSMGGQVDYILDTHGEGLLCVGFLYKTDLDEHIAALEEDVRSLLLFPEPRSYMMGRNNVTHARDTGGVQVIVAQHFEGWEGDLDAAVEGTWRPPESAGS